MQMSIDFSARSLGHSSAQLAADSAGSEWQDMAMAYLKGYARTHSELQALDVRLFAERMGLPNAPDARSWGAIMLKASRLGIIRATNVYAATDHLESHGRPQRVWLSLVAV
jgi:hypothetical protein